MAGGPNRCDDNNECTQDSCQANVGCVNTNLSNSSACNLPGLGQCKTGQCQNGTCRGVNLQDGTGCSASSGECPNGACNGGSCLSRTGISCTTSYSVDLCQSASITGTCTASGECNVSQAPPGFSCPGCAGICLQCFGIQFCLPF